MLFQHFFSSRRQSVWFPFLVTLLSIACVIVVPFWWRFPSEEGPFDKQYPTEKSFDSLRDALQERSRAVSFALESEILRRRTRTLEDFQESFQQQSTIAANVLPPDELFSSLKKRGGLSEAVEKEAFHRFVERQEVAGAVLVNDISEIELVSGEAPENFSSEKEKRAALLAEIRRGIVIWPSGDSLHVLLLIPLVSSVDEVVRTIIFVLKPEDWRRRFSLSEGETYFIPSLSEMFAVDSQGAISQAEYVGSLGEASFFRVKEKLYFITGSRGVFQRGYSQFSQFSRTEDETLSLSFGPRKNFRFSRGVFEARDVGLSSGSKGEPLASGWSLSDRGKEARYSRTLAPGVVLSVLRSLPVLDRSPRVTKKEGDFWAKLRLGLLFSLLVLLPAVTWWFFFSRLRAGAKRKIVALERQKESIGRVAFYLANQLAEMRALVESSYEALNKLREHHLSIDRHNQQIRKEIADEISTEMSAVSFESLYEVAGQLQESIRYVGDIASSLQSIAFQTNRLALNAAVEAARAGEAGKGFAVVAEEVRRLSAESARSSEETKGRMEEMRQLVERTTKIAEQTSSAAENQLEQVQSEIRLFEGRIETLFGPVPDEVAESLEEVSRTMTTLEHELQVLHELIKERITPAERE